MRYPERCQSPESRAELRGNVADMCHEFLRRGDKWWPPYSESTLAELKTFGLITEHEYEYLKKMQRHWEDYYRTHPYSNYQPSQQQFEKAYNYRDW